MDLHSRRKELGLTLEDVPLSKDKRWRLVDIIEKAR